MNARFTIPEQLRITWAQKNFLLLAPILFSMGYGCFVVGSEKPLLDGEPG